MEPWESLFSDIFQNMLSMMIGTALNFSKSHFPVEIKMCFMLSLKLGKDLENPSDKFVSPTESTKGLITTDQIDFKN